MSSFVPTEKAPSIFRFLHPFRKRRLETLQQEGAGMPGSGMRGWSGWIIDQRAVILGIGARLRADDRRAG
jgi:hypothetical protein